MKKRNMLSVCIITKNEENTLADCLKSIIDIADEIIVVDTGSTDRTIEIAKHSGAKVFKRKWNRDFSEIRNYAIDRALGKWILFIDADETIRLEDVKRFGPLLDNPMVEGYLFYILTLLERHGASSPTQSLRLFRNRKEYRYVNRVFERIPEERLTSVKDEPITIIHRPNPERHAQIHQLKVELLVQEIQRYPEDPYLHYVYGIDLLNSEQMEPSIEQFQVALQRVNSFHIFSSHLYKCLVWSLIKVRRYEDALERIDQGVKQFPFYTDLLFMRGQCHKQLKQYQEAIAAFELCLQVGEPPATMVTDGGVGSYRAYFMLGQIHEELCNPALALDFYKRAYESERSFEEPLYWIGTLVKDHPELGETNKVLLECINVIDPEQMMTMIDVLCMQREYGKALAYTEQAESLVGFSEDIAFVRGICYMMTGDGEQAEKFFLLIGKEHPYYGQVLLRRVQNHWFQNQLREAESVLEELVHSSNISGQMQEVYRAVQAILSGEKLLYRDVGSRGYETLAKLIEHFIWLKQDVKAKPLLDWLLQSDQEHLWIKIGELLAENQNFAQVNIIINQLHNKWIKHECIEAVAKRLFVCGHFDSADTILHWGDAEERGVYGYLLWSRVWLNKTVNLINMGMRSRKVDQDTKKKLSEWMELIRLEH